MRQATSTPHVRDLKITQVIFFFVIYSTPFNLLNSNLRKTTKLKKTPWETLGVISFSFSPVLANQVLVFDSQASTLMLSHANELFNFPFVPLSLLEHSPRNSSRSNQHLTGKQLDFLSLGIQRKSKIPKVVLMSDCARTV